MKLPIIYWLLLVIFLMNGLNGKSQNNSVEITTERNKDQSIDFFYEKNDFGSFFLNLTFNQLENATPTSYKGNLNAYSGKFFSIRPLNSNSSIGFSYKYTWIRGILNPKIDTSFVYLLPVAKGKTVKALHHSNIDKKYFGGVEPKNWKSFQFDVEPGDTVFSARKGLVVEVNDGIDPDSSVSVSYCTKSNSILIEHEDGTLASYYVLKKSSLMVKPGQVVYPHTPLALAGTYDVESNSQIRFYVYYLVEENLEKPDKITFATKKNYYAFVNPLFYTSEGNVCLEARQDYTSDFKEEHILKELTKREKKKLGTLKQTVNQ